MTTARLTLRPATVQRATHRLPRDLKAALVGVAIIPILIAALALGSAAAGVKAPPLGGPYPTPEAGLDR